MLMLIMLACCQEISNYNGQVVGIITESVDTGEAQWICGGPFDFILEDTILTGEGSCNYDDYEMSITYEGTLVDQTATGKIIVNYDLYSKIFYETNIDVTTRISIDLNYSLLDYNGQLYIVDELD